MAGFMLPDARMQMPELMEGRKPTEVVKIYDPHDEIYSAYVFPDFVDLKGGYAPAINYNASPKAFGDGEALYCAGGARITIPDIALNEFESLDKFAWQIKFRIKEGTGISNKLVTDKSNFGGGFIFTETQSSASGFLINCGVSYSGHGTVNGFLLGKTYTLLISYDEGTVSVYVNGKLAIPPFAQTKASANGEQLRVFGGDGGSWSLTGWLDSLLFFKVACDEDLVNRAYNYAENFLIPAGT